MPSIWEARALSICATSTTMSVEPGVVDTYVLVYASTPIPKSAGENRPFVRYRRRAERGLMTWEPVLPKIVSTHS